MKKILFAFTLLLAGATSKAQTIALDFNKADCNGISRHLFADLDSGKAVVLFYYMPSCGSCPPPAQQIQAMANHVNAAHPGTVKAYAFPYNNTTACSYSQTWVTSNSLPLYAPMDSGATAVAHYGGFGMPTAVLVGGSNHRVMFSTLSFSASDTTIMRDSILALIGVTTSVHTMPASDANIKVYPNPANDKITVSCMLNQSANVSIGVYDIKGDIVTSVNGTRHDAGAYATNISTARLANGVYTMQLVVDGAVVNKVINVSH
jgi:hypothetical protein